MRKSILILALGLFVSASVANACDGDKACSHSKAKKTSMTTAEKKSCSATAAKSGKMECCMKKSASAAKKVEPKVEDKKG